MKRLLLLVAGVLALAGCRLQVGVDVAMQPDGTGVVTVVANADAELFQKVPGLADELRFEDAVAAGWKVAEPVTNADGSASLTLTHAFATDDELANVLNSLGPPFADMRAARTPGTGDNAGQVTNAVIGRLLLPSGFESFSDNDLTAAVGGLPFGDLITASGLTPAEAMQVTLRVDLPGELVQASGSELEDGSFTWQAPLDGSSANVSYQTVQKPASEGKGWAQPVATMALIALIVWIALAVAFIAFVAWARHSRARKRARALKRLR